ncbi:MAG TPA: LCP family protein [Candidatus Nitrosocosmicus sp.]|nr:LCP family protein [Candidatus Nitrosocosmicus sp.]
MKKRFLIWMILGIFILTLIILTKPFYSFITNTLHISPLKVLLLPSNVKKTNNIVNILLLGKAGGTHEGPNLTDSINVVSINLTTNHITLFSVPRDIWSEPIEEKVNAAYAIGEAKQPGKGGLKLAKAEIGAVIGQPIHYGAVIEFEKFKELIDYFGGIDIDVERSFTDDQFPIPGKEDDTCSGDPNYKCRYKSLSFTKGHQHMNGETALNYVRSRHGNNREGSDFARGKRQQKMIDAVIQETISTIKTLDIKKIEKLYSLYDRIISRDITNENSAYLLKHFVFHKKPVIKQTAIEQSFFEIPDVNEYGRFVLIPKNNDYSILHEYIECLIEGKDKCEDIKAKINE